MCVLEAAAIWVGGVALTGVPYPVYGGCSPPERRWQACSDLLLQSPDGERVFIGKRRVHPQPDWWFVGGRIFPGETPVLPCYVHGASQHALHRVHLHSVHCIVHWHRALASCIGIVHWHRALASCIGIVRYYVCM